MLSHAIKYAFKNGMKRVYLGGGKTQREDDPLLEFKKSFGGELLPFRIGSFIHRRNAYYKMEAAQNEVSLVSGRVLFWR